jgi:CelD/BcsL family acetyltransferase involved in cellulose biosynthesis
VIGKLRLVLLREIPENTDLRRQWNDLVERVDRPQVFYTYEWSLAVQRAYFATLHPLVFLAYDERESLIGVAALSTVPEGGYASFLCATTGDYCDFLSLPEHKSSFVTAVLAELRKQGIRDLTLTNLPADSGTLGAMRQAAPLQQYRCFARTAYVCAQVSLGDLERRDEGKPVLPRKKMLRRFLNAMGREAPVRLDHVREWNAIEPVLPEFMQAHVARFLFTGRISNMARSERRVFLTELAKLLSERGWIALTRMMSGQNVFAWNYGFQFQSTWFWYQPTFESDLEKYSPGFCLLAKLIEEAADNPALQTVDMGLGAEEYKDRFANRTRETLYVTLKSSASQHLREIVRYRAAALVQKYPKVEAAARAVLARLQGVRQILRQKGFAQTASWLGTRALARLWSETEVFFYEWCGSTLAESAGAKLVPLDLNQLAVATSEYVDDPETLTYLLRSAQRLREKSAEGFALVDSVGKLVHFAWASPFHGFFLAELNAKVDAPSPDCVMIFDCWTPAPVRGHGYYGQAIEFIAKGLKVKGNRPWIFSAGSNIASVRGLEKSGFQRSYSLIHQRSLWWQRVKGETPVSNGSDVAEVSARV